jgi:hypothetical protein
MLLHEKYLKPHIVNIVQNERIGQKNVQKKHNKTYR